MARPLVIRGANHALPPATGGAGHWNGTVLVALLLIIVAAVRLHELVPVLRFIKPALLVTFGGTALIWLKTPAPERAALLRHPFMRLVFAYWAFMLVTAPFALWPRLALESVQYFLPGVALAAAILLSRADRPTLSRLQGGFVVAAAVFALAAKLFGRTFADGRLEPMAGMYDSNDMAALLALTFPLALGYARAQRDTARMVGYGAALLLLVAILASGSRGGVLGLGAGAVVYVLGMKGSRRIVALTMLAAVTAGIWAYSPSFKNRMMTLTNLESDYNTYDEFGRKAVWKRGRQYIRENPVIGVGAGNFAIAEGQYFGIVRAGIRGAKWSNAHNAYVQSFAELGLLGGSIFVGILLAGVTYGLRLWRGVRVASGELLHRPELLASLCAFMVSAIFLSHAYFMPLIATGALAALADRVRKAESVRQSDVSPQPAGYARPELLARQAGRAHLAQRQRGGLAS